MTLKRLQRRAPVAGVPEPDRVIATKPTLAACRPARTLTALIRAANGP
jgi:hypothetical protein